MSEECDLCRDPECKDPQWLCEKHDKELAEHAQDEEIEEMLH